MSMMDKAKDQYNKHQDEIKSVEKKMKDKMDKKKDNDSKTMK